jgi:hypothetical protein
VLMNELFTRIYELAFNGDSEDRLCAILLISK